MRARGWGSLWLHYHNSSRSISAHFHHPTMDGSMQLGSARYLYYKVSQQDKNVNTHPRRTLALSLLCFVHARRCFTPYRASIVSSIMLLMRRRGCASHYHSDEPRRLSCAKCLNSYPPTHLSRKRKMIENVSLNSKGKRQRHECVPKFARFHV